MNSLLNPDRPPVFFPGCAHERIVQILGKTFEALGLSGNQIAIVTDTGIFGINDIMDPKDTRDFLVKMLNLHAEGATKGISEHLMSSWPTSF